MDAEARIYIAGRDTMYGQALANHLRGRGFTNLLADCDYTDEESVHDFFATQHPEYVFILGGKSGGITANQTYPVDLLISNLQIAQHVLSAAHEFGVTKLLYLASSCVYPRLCPQPMNESDLMTGPLEPTNAAYATAKLTGMQLCQSYRSQYNDPYIVAIPTNVFGPGDKFDSENSHVVASLMRRMDDAKASGEKSIDVWGTGAPRREFMSVRDMARGCEFMIDHYEAIEPANLGCGESLSIAELAHAIKEVVGFMGEIRFDTSKPDGMPEKVLDSSKLIGLGWKPEDSFAEALRATYEWYREHIQPARV